MPKPVRHATTRHRALCCDCATLPQRFDPDTFTSVVTDPPYGLKFMGKAWDHGVPGTLYWEAIANVCRPGAHLLAFGGTRTFHRLTCAIEDAGWEIRDCLMWLYGSGFPKSHDVSKALDKSAGAERKVVGYDLAKAKQATGQEGTVGHGDRCANDGAITTPATAGAKTWDGYGTALKPAWEPIILARKPLIGTVASNVLRHGTGALNIDGCRVGTSDRYSYPQGPGGKSHHYSSSKRSAEVHPNPTESHPLGRWPANVIHDGDEGVVGPMGDAARFFYCAKAGQKERTAGGGVENRHPTVKPLVLMRYLLKLVASPEENYVLDPFCGSGSTLVACKQMGLGCVGLDIDRESIIATIKRLGLTKEAYHAKTQQARQ